MITRQEIEGKFKSIKGKSQYLRVSDTHPLELYLGINEDGNYTLRFNGIFSQIKILGNDLLKIKQIRMSNYNSLLFSFNSQENVSLFYHFCEDIINKTSDYCGNNPYAEIVNRYNQWKKMFYGVTSTLSEPQIIGLIGELYFLNHFAITKYGETEALNGWSGPEPTHKDFSYGNGWYEIKAINNHKSSVTISSLEQLDSENDGRLIVVILEKMSPSFNGISLNKFAKEILDSLSFEDSKDIFIAKLKQAGYSYNEVYDNFVYNFVSIKQYIVSNDFPRLRIAELPKGVVEVKYEIELSQIEKYEDKNNG